MYDTRPECPPQAPFIKDALDFTNYIMINSINFGYLEFNGSGEPTLYLIYQEFDLAAQEQRMRDKHPNWTVRQCRCCRYYQRGAKNRVEKEARDFIKDKEGYTVLLRPEGNGLNLFSTFRFHGIKLEKNYETQDKIIFAMLAGPSKEPIGLRRWFEVEES